MGKIRRFMILTGLSIFLFGLIGCDQTTEDIDLSHIERIQLSFETNSDSVISTIVIDQDLIDSINVEAIKDVTLDDLTFLMPVKTGFVLENWYFDAALTQPLVEDSPIVVAYIEILKLENVEIDITLYAKWIPETIKTYDVSYHLDGGINNDANPLTFTSTETQALFNPTKDGYTFIGWYDNPSFSGSIYTEIALDTENDLDLYALWEENTTNHTSYTVTYHLDGGVNNDANPLTFTNTETQALFNPTKDGYTFIGWYDNPSFSGSIYTEIALDTENDLDLYALWEENTTNHTSYTVTYHLDGGINNLENIVIFDASDEDFKLLDALKDGHTFMGWYSDSDFTQLVTMIYTDATENIELWAKWGNASILTFLLVDDVYFVKQCQEDYSGIVVVPSSFNGKPVVGIDEDAFALCTNVTEVVLAESVTYIGAGAFSWCESLETINIENVYYIGSSAFENCDSLEHIVIGENLTSIEPFTFNSCESLLSVELGKNVSFIGKQAFSFTPLTSIILNDGLYSIDESAFMNCHNLSNIYLPSSLAYIGKYAFNNCENLVIYAGASNQPSTWEDEWNSGENQIYWDLLRGQVPDETEIYYILYHLDGGNNHPDNPITYKGDSDILLNDPMKDGYIFEGWFIDSTLTNQITTIPSGQSGDVELWASWVEDPAPTYLSYEVFDDYVAITGLLEPLTHVDIPESYQGKPVTVIAENAFYYQYDLLSVSLPETITTIEDHAFTGCQNLTSINFPSSLKNLGSGAFYQAAFTEIDLPDTIENYGMHIFQSNRLLVTVTLPENMTYIPEMMFSDCINLEMINIPKSVELIEANAFSDCESLTNIDLSNVKVIHEYAFSNCSSITSLVLSNKITTIEKYTFFNLDALMMVQLPENLEVISDYAFASCTNLTEIDLPDSLMFIGDNAFSGCHLTSLNLPNDLEYIGKEAFKSNDFTNLYLPKDLKIINEVAFWKCDQLEYVYLPSSIEIINGRIFRETGTSVKIYIDSEEVPSTWDETWSDYFYGTIDYEHPFLSVSITYELDGGENNSLNPETIGPCSNLILMAPTKEGYNFEGWYDDETFTNQVIDIDQGRTSDISLYAKWTLKPETQVNINYHLNGGKNLLSAPDYFNGLDGVNLVDPTKAGWAFKGWFSDSSFTSRVISIPEGTTSDINLYAKWEMDYLLYEEFDDYVKITGLNIPMTIVEIPSYINGKPVTIIGNSAFYNERVILEVILPSTITSIEYGAFQSCENMLSISLPEGLLSIGSNAFSYCKELTEVVIPSTVEILGEKLFAWDNKLDTVVFNNPITLIPYGTFENCLSMVEFHVPEGVIEIGTYAFYGCLNLEILTLPESLEIIHSYAFKYLPSLKTVTFPDQLKEIGDYAFSESGITAFILPDSLTTLGKEVFTYCYDLTTFHIGASLESILTYADFKKTTALKTLTISEDNLLYSMNGSALIVQKDLLTLVKYMTTRGGGTYDIPDGVEEIGPYAFEDSSLRSITIPNSVTTINNRAFNNCDQLASIYIPMSVTSIKYYAFSTSQTITILVASESLPDTWDSYWVSNNNNIFWGVDIDDIGVYHDAIDYVIIDDHIEIIGLNNYGPSPQVLIPSEIDTYPVTVIHTNAFKENNSGMYIIPSSVTTIHQGAFNSYNVTIYCQASSRPSGWDSYWDQTKANVTWNAVWFTYDTQDGNDYFPTVSTPDNLKSLGYGWTPVRTGFIFGGWYTDKACTDGNEFIFPSIENDPLIMPATNTTIYAKWIPES